jgi:hypothetical protein
MAVITSCFLVGCGSFNLLLFVLPSSLWSAFLPPYYWQSLTSSVSYHISLTYVIVSAKGVQIFHKFRTHLRILGARNVRWSKFHAEDPGSFAITIQNLVSWDLCTPGLWWFQGPKRPHAVWLDSVPETLVLTMPCCSCVFSHPGLLVCRARNHVITCSWPYSLAALWMAFIWTTLIYHQILYN